MPRTESRQHSPSLLLDEAERQFSKRGYAAVTLRDIGQALGLSHASIYYHFPGGKEELFTAVTRRSIERHGEALKAILDDSRGDIRGQLAGAAHWLLSQEPLDLIRMEESDMPAIDQDAAKDLSGMLYGKILLRIQDALQEADENGEIHCPHPGLAGNALVGMIESFHAVPPYAIRGSKLEMALEMIDVVLKGLDYRPKAQPGNGSPSGQAIPGAGAGNI
ncbi:MAG TPA: TetR/AcrR family transcriptional regulator [Rectinemataceae bacterium]